MTCRQQKNLGNETTNDTLSSEVKNSTMVASPVKMDIQKCVQWPFELDYSSRFGTVRTNIETLPVETLSVIAAVWMDA